jgi:mxaJ protein
MIADRRFLVRALAALVVIVLLTAGIVALSHRMPRRTLRVCSDPNNMPWSNQAGAGFENALARLVADELDARLEYTWWAQRRGFVRNTLRAHRCDVILGIPSSLELVLVTRPYYRSTYVFASRAEDSLEFASFDDPVLRTLRIGVQIIGDDYANSPPAHALAARGLVRNVTGYSVYGNYAEPDPPADIMRALLDDRIDVAVAWGPLAGWFARTSHLPLRLTPVQPQIDVPYLPMVFDISMGVRREDLALRDPPPPARHWAHPRSLWRAARPLSSHCRRAACIFGAARQDVRVG